jgi:hypothetical protein
MHIKKVLSDLKEKKQDCLQIFDCYLETKLFGVYFNHVSCLSSSSGEFNKHQKILFHDSIRKLEDNPVIFF